MLRLLAGPLAVLLAVPLAAACSGSSEESDPRPRTTPAASSSPRPAPAPPAPKPVPALQRLGLTSLTVQLAGHARHTVTKRKVWGSAVMDRYESDWSGVVVVRDTRPVGWDLPSALRTEAEDRAGTLGEVDRAKVDGRAALSGPIGFVVDGVPQTRVVTTVACGDLLVYVWVAQDADGTVDPRLRQVVPSLRFRRDCGGPAAGPA